MTVSRQSGGLAVLLFVLLDWPLWALIYNFLARRNGGLQLEVEGDWPDAVEVA